MTDRGQEGRRQPALALSWSGGKDSSFTLWVLRTELGRDPRALITTVTEGFDRISMHGVRRTLLVDQADSAGVPLLEVPLPQACPNDVYEARMAQAFASAQLRDVDEIAFGDLFLEDIRAYRENHVIAAGKTPIFPVWQRDTTQLARDFVDAGFEAIVVVVDSKRLDPSFAGRRFDHSFLDDLPDVIDPCGENGEFHTFVYQGPIFSRPIACENGEVVTRDGFVFADVLPV